MGNPVPEAAAATACAAIVAGCAPYDNNECPASIGNPDGTPDKDPGCPGMPVPWPNGGVKNPGLGRKDARPSKLAFSSTSGLLAVEWDRTDLRSSLGDNCSFGEHSGSICPPYSPDGLPPRFKIASMQNDLEFAFSAPYLASRCDMLDRDTASTKFTTAGRP